MKLCTLDRGGRDGRLAVVSRDLTICQAVSDIAPTLQSALDDWSGCEPRLREVSAALENAHARHAEPFEPRACLAPLPRAFQWADCSAYLSHVLLARRARGVPAPEDLESVPLIYQGGSDDMLPATAEIPADPCWGADFEAELAVITGDVPAATGEAEAAAHIRLLTLVNDVSLRALVPAELARGFGFYQSKPASSFAPVAVTTDELGSAWQGCRVHLEMRVDLNGRPFGRVAAGRTMHFSFAGLIAHAARTRRLAAGSIIGSGTVSEHQADLVSSLVENGGSGCCCLLERRLLETLDGGTARTPLLRPGDRVHIEMLDGDGASVFGAIDNRYVEPAVAPVNRGGDQAPR
ncbi:MAG: fumarylacetoacetate hydrolase family protein [Rhodocyclaceae bacterium]|nr:fumarylacetoacetate hydrolase family protein [Rhodocyclaceae bacterium]